MNVMKENDISQMPVMDNGSIIGSITETSVLNYILENPMNNTEKQVEAIMNEPFPTVKTDVPCSRLRQYINKQIPAVVAQDKAGSMHVITKYDIIQAM